MLLGSGLEPVPAVIESSAFNNDSLVFEYINDNVIDDDYNDHFAPCSCVDTCSVSSGNGCLCINNSSGHLYDDKKTIINVNPYSANLRFLQECNTLCKCSDDCINRVVQHGVSRQLAVFETGTPKGLGVKAGEMIPKHSFVCEYAGHAHLVETQHLQKSNECPQMKSSFNYVLYVNECFGRKEMTTVIDATKKGNISRLINHSCDPNLFMVPVRVNSIIPHIALFALRDIEMGDELSYNYSGNLQGTSQPTNLSKKPCLCGSVNCKKFLPV